MRRITRRLGRTAAALLLVSCLAPAALAFQDPLEAPSTPSALASKSPLTAVAAAGDRLVAVGQRGHILLSDDAAKSWSQAKVPVSSDLVAVHFPTAMQGWAVGHDGVVLHSADGGWSWKKQLDGRAAAKLMVDFYAKESGAGEAERQKALAEAKRFAEQGPVHPFLDVWFESEKVGFVVGAFGLIFETRDGGNSWLPWFDRTENPGGLHLYGIRGWKENLFVVGEQGLILKLDSQSRRFVALPGPYQGTYFGVLPGPDSVLVYGMRGNAYCSADVGKTWKKADTQSSAGLTSGVALRDGRLVLVTQGGETLVSSDRGGSFSRLPTGKSAPLAGVAVAGDAGVAVVGFHGVGFEALK